MFMSYRRSVLLAQPRAKDAKHRNRSRRRGKKQTFAHTGALLLINSAFVRHIAYAVREQFFSRLSPHSRTHGEYRAGHNAEESTTEAHYRASDR